MFENIRELGEYVPGKINSLDFKIPSVKISRNDTIDMKNNIMSIGYLPPKEFRKRFLEDQSFREKYVKKLEAKLNEK